MSRSDVPLRWAEAGCRRGRLWSLLAAAVVGAGIASAAAAETPDAALAALLDEARAEAASPGACARPDADKLVKILCAGVLRVGARTEYPLFGVRGDGDWQGYEIEVARKIGDLLGVRPVFSKVKAATRIPLLGEDSIDLIIATMGHNTQRDSQVRFIRPHYYRSESILVGPRRLQAADWKDIQGRTVCVTVGNGSNAELVSRGVRLMLFDEAVMLPERLVDQTCTLAAQDDSFFAYYLADPSFAARFDTKLGFGQVPWGMGVPRQGADRLARALDLMSQIYHRDGVFLAIALANRIGTVFLRQQQAVWNRPECDTAAGSTNPACVIAPTNAELQPTPFAAEVADFEGWFRRLTGIDLLLPMLKTMPAWTVFHSGVVNSLLLIVGALGATLTFALAFGAAMASRSRLLRWPARAVTVALQSSPIVLTLVIAASVFHALLPYSAAMALAAASIALGLANGSNAGQAIAEACHTLEAERGAAASRFDLFSRALSRSATQIVAFLINAAKGTPIASFIGAPELLSALTDITSFSSGRGTTYTLLLVFYTSVVILVVWLCRRFQGYLDRSHAAS